MTAKKTAPAAATPDTEAAAPAGKPAAKAVSVADKPAKVAAKAAAGATAGAAESVPAAPAMGIQGLRTEGSFRLHPPPQRERVRTDNRPIRLVAAQADPLEDAVQGAGRSGVVLHKSPATRQRAAYKRRRA